jgi:O-antigen/teichoic acid export membrane protein
MTTRYLAAVAVLASAAIHLTLWFQGMRDVRVIGPAFLVNVISGVVIAVLLVRWRHWVPGALAACFGLATLSAFTLASTVGLYGDHPSWQGFYVFGAAAAEVVAVMTGLALVLDDPEPEPVQPWLDPALSNRSDRA